MSLRQPMPPSAETRQGRGWPSFTTGSMAALGLLVVASWAYLLTADDSGVVDLFQAGTWRRAWGFIQELAGKGSGSTPAFLDTGSWRTAGTLSVKTLAMSVLAVAMAGAGVLLTFLPAARNVAFGELSGSRSWVGPVAFFLLRGIYTFTRGIPELLWAMLIIFVLSPGPLPAAMALAVHNYGILGKLSAEVVEDMDPRPARALRSTGAGTFQLLVYAVVPQALPQLLTYLLYRWEVIIRTTVVVGFVAAGGLGREFRLRMSFFQYDEVALLLLCYLVLVVGVDLASTSLRRLAR